MKKIIAILLFSVSSAYAGNIIVQAPAASVAGVTSISSTSVGGTPITGAFQLLKGTGILLTQSGQGITISTTGSAGTSLTDAFSTDIGSWWPFGYAYGGGTISLSSNTLYGFELPPAPLATSTAAVVIWGGSGNGQLSIWNAQMTTLLSSSSVTAVCGGCAAQINFPIPFQFQANTTYVLAYSGDTNSVGMNTSGASNTIMNVNASHPRMWLCGNSVSWSGSVPTNPSTCGTRNAFNPQGAPQIMFDH